MWATRDNIKIQRLATTNLPLRVIQNGNMILVDTGRLKSEQTEMNKLSKYSNRDDFKLIVLTHTHPDHLETLENIVNIWPVNVLVHESEVENVIKLVDENKIITMKKAISSFNITLTDPSE